MRFLAYIKPCEFKILLYINFISKDLFYNSRMYFRHQNNICKILLLILLQSFPGKPDFLRW